MLGRKNMSSTTPPGDGLLDIMKSGIVSDTIHDVFEYVLDLWITSVLCYIGTIGNFITIVVFAKLGFQNTINISMTSIAVWDLLKCLLNVCIRVYGPIQLVSPIEARNWKIITSVYLGYLHTFSGYISGVLAAYVALERCLCVSLPFTVKFLLTRKVVIFTNAIVPILVFAFHSLVFSIITYSYVYSPKFNASVAIVYLKPFHYKYPAIDVYTSIMSMLSPCFTFVIMCVCTVIISYFLRQASKTRTSMKETMTSESQEGTNQLSARDRQVIKMLLIIIAVYIVTYIPKIIMYVATLVVPGFRPSGRYGNLKWITIYFMFVFDTVNAMANPFIFFFMSSAFKETLVGMFSSGKKKIAAVCP